MQAIPLHIAPVLTNQQQPSVNPNQQTAMQPLHAQFQVPYNPNQNPQGQMAGMPYVAAPNQHGPNQNPQGQMAGMPYVAAPNQHGPNQNPQRQMAAMPYVAAPNQHGMHYLPQAAGFGPQQQPRAAEPVTHQPAITHAAAATTRDNHLKLPRYALTMSVVVYVMFVALMCWIPGNLCLIPAMITAIMVSNREGHGI